MRRRTIHSFVASALLLAGAYANAQQAPRTPDAAAVPAKMPFDTPLGTPISIERAKQLIDAVTAEARRRNWKYDVTVVDPNGDLIAFERMDGASLAAIGVSQGKARTAARFRRETRWFFDTFESGHAFIATLEPGIVASPGGIPLIQDGKIIGAIGCSGGTGDQDGLLCKVGADLVK